MVRLVQGVACCAPIGMQHATNGVSAQQPTQQPAQQQARPPCEATAETAQQGAQQARNWDATNRPVWEREKLRPGKSGATGGITSGDTRRTCGECANLNPDGLCLAAWRGRDVFGASRKYHPIPDLPQHCPEYLPGPDDVDRRTGRERWPSLQVVERATIG